MNILFIVNELGYRGTPRYLINCATLARQAGHGILIWALTEGGAGEQTCAERGLPVQDFSSWPKEIQPRIVRVPRLQGAEQLSAFYSACDLTMNFSPIGESFGYVVAESMSCGTPVVAQSKPRNDNAQIELAGSQYGCYPVKDAQAAAQVILDCAKNPPSPEQKRRCRDSIVKRYSFEAFAPRLEKVYQTLAATNLRGRSLEHELVNAGFEADIPDEEIKKRLASVIGGRPPLVERIKMRLAYSFPNAIRIQRIIFRRAFPQPVPEILT